ncbi:SDR family oxidoreductase [Candidatus Woesearchaeota archaeon]|nr:SDR family oxidoreductase [Candidatus Woesearchaeota archaeon]
MKTIKQLMNMSGRTSLVTGATGGLGKHMAETLAELGSDLILVDRPKSDYSTLIEALKQYKASSIECIECDLESFEQRVDLIQQINKKKLSVDVLINNAAFGGTINLEGWVVPFEEQTVDTWRRAIEVNLTAAFDLSKALLPKLKKSGNSSIINVASIYGVTGPVHSMYEDTEMGNPAAYSASKGGLIQFTRWLATTIAPEVRVNAISPGGIYRNQPESFVNRYNERTPLGRMAAEEDLKGIIAYLASDMSKYVTGQNINIDGGWTVW